MICHGESSPKKFFMILIVFIVLIFLVLGTAAFCVFFDQAVFTRRGTIYRVKTNEQRVVLTFDDGPSPLWTPPILEQLHKEKIPATFFMIGHHVKKYPTIAKRVAQEGHTIGNHTYAHSVLLYYTPEEIEEEIKYAEMVIKEATGQTTKLFRPPKALMMHHLKDKIKSMGYNIILWSLNSKDWVSFNHHMIVQFILKKVRSGDIILFHDSGNVFSAEGGKRSQTVKAIPLLAKALRQKGFEFVSIERLLNE